ncbi:MAG: hypothetical protein CVT49_09585 [candidate division Zixibacteria bacterium HGW-Zixibacteria-1]|nr:MAG: hypothetical protein CVT49_09585 [candidate division Zixibacteria bacterium HGW-Zixibacteria-1]
MCRKTYLSGGIACLMIAILILPAAPATAQDNIDEIIIGKYHKIQSTILGEERTISVYLPDGYEDSKDIFPVLYILDGGSKTRLMLAASAMEDIDSKGRMPQMIVIGIDSPNSPRDYFPLIFQDRPGTGEADNFIRFFTDELIPWVDTSFHSADYRILSGCSNAGLFTVYTFLTRPETFNAYIAASPSIGWFKEFMLEKTKTSLPGGQMAGRPIYMNYATDDIESIVTGAMPEFVDIFRNHAPADLRWTMEVFEGAGHVPYASCHNGLSYIFGDWQYPAEKLKAGGLESLKEHYKKLSDKYGFRVRVHSDHLRDLGMDFYQAQEYDKAIEVFSFYADEYPESGRGYYFLGAAHDKKGDRELAIKYLEKAVELDPEFPPAKIKLEQVKAGG